MDKVQKYNSFNTNTPSSESYRNYLGYFMLYICCYCDLNDQFVTYNLKSSFVFY